MKLNYLFENLKQNFPLNQEVAWIEKSGNKNYQFKNSTDKKLSDGNRVLGTKNEVKFKYDPSNINNQYVCHTHPTSNKNDDLNAYPSEKDLIAAKKLKKDGAVGIKIYGDNDRLMTIKPKDTGTVQKSRFNKYEDKLRNGDFNGANKELDMMGFDVKLDRV